MVVTCTFMFAGRHDLASLHSRVMMGQEDEQQRSDDHIYRPCCSPTKLSPLSLLYIDTAGNINSKVIPDMSVDSCGCA